jgi:anti-anti-sigma factor
MERELKLELRKKYGYDIIDVSGDISYEAFEIVDEFIAQNISKETKYLIFNMERVKYINSSALSLLIKLTHEMTIKKINVYLMNINEEIDALMRMTGVKKVFNFIKSEDVLIKKLQSEELDNILDITDDD